MNESKLVDIENVMMITTIDKARSLLKEEIFDKMVIVERWLPGTDSEIGIAFESKKNKASKKYYRPVKTLRPIIKDCKVDWGYSEDKIVSALKILSLLGWNNPVFWVPTSAYPMMIKTGRNEINKETETVILIAPRVFDGE